MLKLTGEYKLSYRDKQHNASLPTIQQLLNTRRVAEAKNSLLRPNSVSHCKHSLAPLNVQIGAVKEAEVIVELFEQISQLWQVFRVPASALRVIVKRNVRNIGSVAWRPVMSLS